MFKCCSPRKKKKKGTLKKQQPDKTTALRQDAAAGALERDNPQQGDQAGTSRAWVRAGPGGGPRTGDVKAIEDDVSSSATQDRATKTSPVKSGNGVGAVDTHLRDVVTNSQTASRGIMGSGVAATQSSDVQSRGGVEGDHLQNNDDVAGGDQRSARKISGLEEKTVLPEEYGCILLQISDVVVPGQEDITAKDALLLWSRRTTEGYPGVQIRDFSTSWRDGKAFLSILHRNRPDLVDVRTMRQSSNKQNLETAFSVAERELGVTRLLDVDDVDVAHPDEKSIITYVSSLYDVFPEVPSLEQSLRDNERKVKVEDYRDLVSSLLVWLRDGIKLMLSRNYPTTLFELKALQSDFNRFRHEDVPPHLESKNRALRLFDEIQSLTTDPSHMSIEDEYLPHNLTRMWSRFEAAMQERDMTLQAEVIRLERLQRLADKAQRDIRFQEETLADIGRKIDDTLRSMDVMHAFEAKRNCDALDRSIKNVEESLRGLFRDCQTLQDGNHPLAEQLYTRVSDLQAKVSSLKNRLYSHVVQPLLSRSMDDGQASMTKSRAEFVSEARFTEMHPAFRHLQDCLDWIDVKQRHLESLNYEKEVAGMLEQLESHRREHEDIQAFRARIDKCVSDRTSLSSEEQKTYTQKLSKVEVAYSLLSKISSRRLRCLDSLSEFLHLATAELIWLNEREDVELSRDWSAKDINLSELDEYHKSLTRHMESRESQFNSVQEKGGAMILDRHPSAQIVEAYMSSLQSQWSWLVHLSWCLEAQIKHWTEHNSFFEEAQHCEQWMTRHSELLQNRFSADNIPIDQAQVLLADLQAIQDQIREYDRRITSLVIRSLDVLPLKLRSQKVTAPIRVRTLCACHQHDVSLQRGEECFLVNNSQRSHWKVQTMTGLEVDVPSVCLLIPPPNQEAIDVANRLKLQHERLSSLWKTQQRKVRMAAIFAAIRQIKGWDLKKFLAMDPTQREAVWRALKEDGQKLIAECDTTDRDMRKLKEELKDCELIYQNLSKRASEKEGKQTASSAQILLLKVDNMSRELMASDQLLNTLLHRPLPQNNLAVQESFRSYREFQLKFDKQENEIKVLQTEVKGLSPHNSNIESKLNLIVQKAEQMKAVSHIYVDRLKGCEVVISGLNDVKQLIAELESSLAAHDNMTSDLSELKTLKNELVSFQESLQQHQPKLHHLKKDVDSLRSLVESSRPGTAKHHDVDGLEQEVKNLAKRWDQICIHVVERLRSVGSCQDLLSLYHNGLHAEQTWASQMEKRISSQPILSGDLVDAKPQLEPTMAIYNALGDRRHQIESVNRYGGQFIREAKISDKRLKQFKDVISESSALFKVPDSKRKRQQDGADVVRDELDQLNKLYMEMVDWANIRLKQISAILSANGQMQFQIVIDEEIPLLRTFRAELAKRSSMLVDSDMKEYFTQQFDGPTPSLASYKTTQEQVYKSTLQIRAEPALTGELAEYTKVLKIQPKDKQQGQEVSPEKAAESNVTSDLFMTLKAMESCSTLLAVPALASPTKLLGPKQQLKCYEQVLVTIQKEEILSRGQICHANVILNPKTLKKITIAEAIQSGILDLKSKTFVDPCSVQRLSLAHAVKRGFMDEVALKQLTCPCGAQDPQSGQELSLMEAIQKKLYDPATNTFNDATTGEPVSVPEAVSRGLISDSCSHLLTGEVVEVTSIRRLQAVFRNSDHFKLERGLSLGKVLERRLCSDITGKVKDPVSGTDMTIMAAVETGLINPNFAEIKDPQSGRVLTLTEAVALSIVDPFKGTYSDKSTRQKQSLLSALNKNLVKSATSLSDVVKQGNLTETGLVFEASSGQTIPLSLAIETGAICSESKCFLHPATQSVLSIKEAATQGIVTPSGMFVNLKDQTHHSLLEALRLGVIQLVHEDIQFSRSGVKDTRTNEIVSLSEAFSKGIITPQGAYVDNRTGREMSLQQASNAGLLDRNLMKDLHKPMSMTDVQGRHISITEALKLGMLDSENGFLQNAKTREMLSMQEATSLGLITASDATTVLSLLSPLMTSSVVLTQDTSSQPRNAFTVSQAVLHGYLNEKTGIFTDPHTGQSMALEEAIYKGLIKLTSDWPLPPALSAAISQSQVRKVQLESFMTDTSGSTTKTIPIEPGSKQFESGYLTKSDLGYSFTATLLAKPLMMSSASVEKREINLVSVVDPRTGRELEVQDAIKRGLISLEQGQYIHPITGEKMSINKAIERNFIKAEQHGEGQLGGESIKDTRIFSIIGVLHPRTKQQLAVSTALDEGILDQTKGLYNYIDDQGNIKPMKISEAIEKGFVIVEDMDDMGLSPDSILRETRSYILKSVFHPVTGKNISIAEAIAQGVLDESEGLYLNLVTGERVPIHSAIERGLIQAELTSVKTDVDRNINKITTTKLTTLAVTAVVDPRTNKLITVSKAIEEGILNQNKGIYTNPLTGESMTISDAIDKRLILAESPEARSDDPLERAEISSIHITDDHEASETTLVEDLRSETVNMSISSVLNPNTKQLISYDDAVKAGIIDVKQGVYINLVSGETMPITTALDKDLIHGEVTSKSRENDIMRSTVSSALPSFSARDITSVLDPRTGSEISLDKAVKDGIVNPEKGTFINPRTRTEISLENAKELGYLLESKQSTAAQLEKSLEEENLLQAKLSSPRVPKESSQPWSKVDIELEKTVVSDGKNQLAKEVLQYSPSIENMSDRAQISQLEDDARFKKYSAAGVKTGSVDSDSSRAGAGKGSALEALKKGLMVVAGAPVIAAKMAVDEIRDRNSNITKTSNIHPKVYWDSGEPHPSTLKADSESSIQEQRRSLGSRSKSPTVGVVGKPVTLTVDPGSPAVSNYKNKEEVTRITIQQTLPIRESPEAVPSSRFSSSVTNEAEQSENNMGQNGSKIPADKTSVSSLRSRFESSSSFSNSKIPNSQKIREGSPVRSSHLDNQTGTDRQMEVKDLDINWETGRVVNRLDGQKLSVREAVKEGLLDANLLTHLSSQKFNASPDVVNNGEQGTAKNLTTDQTFNVTSALQHGLTEAPTTSMLASTAEVTTSFAASGKKVLSDSVQPPTSMKAVHKDKRKSITSQEVDSSPKFGFSENESVPNIINGTDRMKPLSLTEAVKLGQVSDDFKTFTDSESGRRMSLVEAIQSGYIKSHTEPQEPEKTYKDRKEIKGRKNISVLEKGNLYLETSQELTTAGPKSSLDEAVEMGLITSEDLHLFDANYNKQRGTQDVHFDTAVNEGRSEGQAVSPIQAIQRGLFNKQQGIVHDPRAEEDLSLLGALSHSKIDRESVKSRTKSGEIYSPEEGLRQGAVDPVSGKYLDEASGRQMTLKDAAKIGVLAVVGAPIAAAVAAKDSLSSYLNDSSSKQSRDRDTASVSSQEQTIRQKDYPSLSATDSRTNFEENSNGWKDDLEISESIKNQKDASDSKKESQYALNEAGIKATSGEDVAKLLGKSQISVAKERTEDKRSGKTMETSISGTMTQTLEKGNKTTFEKQASQLQAEATQQSSLIPKKNILSDTKEKEDGCNLKISRSDILSESQTIRQGSLGNENDSLSDEIVGNRQSTDFKRIPPEIPSKVKPGLSDLNKKNAKQINVTKVYDPLSGNTIDLDEAIDVGLIDEDCTVFNDPVTGKQKKLEDALKEGLVLGSIQTVSSQTATSSKQQSGTYNITGVVDPVTGQELGVEEALKRGILDPSGKYTDILDGNTIPLNEAMKRGLVISEKVQKPQAQVRAQQQREGGVTFSDALKYDLINPSLGEFVDESSQRVMSVDEAVRSGLIVASDGQPFEYTGVGDCGVTYSFKAALQTGIINTETCLFYDSLTGDSISIEQALEEGYLSPIAGTYGARAVRDSIVLLKEGVASSAASATEEIIDSKTGEKLSLAEAEERGLVTIITPDNKMTLHQAMQSGLIDRESGLFHNPTTGNSLSVDQAVLSGILAVDDNDTAVHDYAYDDGDVTDATPLTLAAAISQGFLDTNTATFTDPESHETLTVVEAVQRGLLVPTSSVGAPEIYPTSELPEGRRGISDHLQTWQRVTTGPATQEMQNPDLSHGASQTQQVAAHKKGDKRVVSGEGAVKPDVREDSHKLTSQTAGRQARPATPTTPGRMADSYDKLLQDMSSQILKLQNFELSMKEDTQIENEATRLQNQLQAHKALHEDILSYQQPILSLVYQAEQLTELYQEELLPEQVTQLSGHAASLKKALEKVVKTSDRRLKHMSTAAEALSKLELELEKFNTWKSSAREELLEQEERLKRFEEVKSLQESQKELMTDIVSHQADIRFMSMAVQTFVEEAKLYKLEVDSYRADRQRPARSSLISMDCVPADAVKDRLKEATDDYSSLRHKCSAFGEHLVELNNKQRNFNETAFKMISWLADTENDLVSFSQEMDTTDPDKLPGQLNRIKSLSSEVLSQSGLMDDVRRKGQELSSTLHGLAIDQDEVEKLVQNIEDIDARYASINQAVSSQAKLLQATLTQSQDIQAALTDIQSHLGSAHLALSSLQPVSLELAVLADQEQQFKLVAADIDSYGDSVQSLKQAIVSLGQSGDHRLVKTMEQQLAEIEELYQTVLETCDDRASALRDVSGKLNSFQDKLDTTETWLQAQVDLINSRDFSSLPLHEAKEQLAEVSKDRKKTEADVVKLKETAKDLKEDARTGRPTVLDNAVTGLDRKLAEFDETLHERQADLLQREKQASQFETEKALMLLWLAQMEARVDELEPPALEVDLVEKQLAELQPLLEEYEEHASKVDEINDTGNALEALTSSGDHPLTPIRRLGRSHKILGVTSPRIRSPSPSFPMSPTILKTSLSSESSGVSSRKSSADNLLLDDLSETQQQLLDINQRYDILGERLTDCQQDLQQALSTVKAFLQEMNHLLAWLEDKDQDFSSRASQSIPANEKAAKQKLKDHEEFHREIMSKEGLVEDIRKKAQELVKLKPGVPGVESLQSQLSELDEKWHGLRALSEEHRKGLEDAITDLQNFRENEEQLSRWFGQKEKLLDVLGPVAMEPSLLRSQMEQVKVLKEEFTCQEPTYKQFVDTGHAILDWCEANTSHSSAISKRMDIISKAWSKLQGRLKDREKNLESVEGLSAEFSGITRELANWLGDLSDRIDGLPKVSTQPDKQKKQKLEMQNIEQEIQQKLAQVSKAKDLCQQLCDTSKDLSTKSDLRAKMSALDKDLHDTIKKLEARANAIEEASKAGEEFTDKCHQMLGWIQKTASSVSEAPAVTSDADLLQQQAVDTKSLKQDLNLKEVEVHSLLEKGKKFIHEASPTAETKAFTETISLLENEWQELKEAMNEREHRIKVASNQTKDFNQKMDKMTWWLDTAEDRLKKMTIDSLDKATITAKLKELQSLQNEIMKKSHDYDSFCTTADALLNSVEDPEDRLRQQIDEINSRWSSLNSGVAETAESLEDLQSRLAEIEDNKTEARHSITRWEDKLAAHMDMGTAARDPRHIEKIKTLQEDVQALLPQLDYLGKQVEALAGRENLDTSSLDSEVDALRQRHGQLQADVGELITNMEAGSTIVSQFQDMMKKVSSQLLQLENDLSNKRPVSREEQELQAQLYEIQNFQAELLEKSEPLADLHEQAQDLQLAGFVADPEGLQAQVEALLAQHQRLEDKSNQRLADITSNLDRVQQIGDALKDLHRKVDDAMSTIDSLKPVGSSAGLIKEQQEDLKKFTKTEMEPLQKEINALSTDIESFLKSTPSTTSSGGIDEELESIHQVWSQLNDKVSERERSLDQAWLQAGKFQEALASLLTWMDETEEAAANQKPASPEFRVVKAQLQEQKLLLKMIEDRAPSVASVKNTGQQLLSGLTGAEHSRMDKELKALDKRWALLTDRVTDRMKVLEETSDLAKSFQDLHESLAAWLDVSDKKFASLEPKSPSASGIENLIEELKNLQQDICEHEGPVKELTTFGRRLQDICKGEDLVIVQMKIDKIQKQFSDLKNKVDDSLEQMEEALPLAQDFQEAHEKFLEWVAVVEPQLKAMEQAGSEVEDKVEELLEQLEAVQPCLEVINSEGAQLAEVALGEAGLQVEELISKDNKKFDSLRQQVEKRADKMRLSRQKSLECISELDELLDWFQKGEERLTTMSPISAEPDELRKQLGKIKSFMDEVGNQKTQVREAFTAGRKLLRESSKEEAGAIQQKLDQLKNAADTVGHLAAERHNQLDQALPLARSFQDTHENLVAWLDEVEPALSDLEITAVDPSQVRKQQESIKALKKEVADQKPVIDRLNKTGAALVQLVSSEAAEDVQNKLDQDNQRVEDVRNKARERSNSIDAAMQQSAEFADKLEDMLETLTTTAEMVQNAEPISAHPDKIREQIQENKIIDEDMQMKSDALGIVKEAADELIKQAGDASDPAVRDVRQKLEELTRLYTDIENNCQDRDRALEDALGVSEKFWEDLHSLSGSIKELQEAMAHHTKPALEPEAIREQQEELEAFREDLAATQADLEDLQETGDHLMTLVGDPERPEVKKNLDDTEQLLNNISNQVEKRSKDLDVALGKAITFQEELQKVLVWMQTHEDTLTEMEPVAGDLDTVKSQWNDIKVFKSIVDPKHVEVEALNQQVEDLAKDHTAEQAVVVWEPVREVNERWSNLQTGIGDRQRHIQVALLSLGQFEQALREFQSWMDNANTALDELQPVYGDPRVIELELAKLKGIVNDINNHQDSLELLSEESEKLMSKEKTAEANKLRKTMAGLVKNFERLQEKAANKQQQLEAAKREAVGFSEELQDIMLKMNDFDGQLITSQPVGGLPETAKEQLDKFMDTYEDIEKLEPAVQSLQLMSEKLAAKSQGQPAASIRQNMANLQQRFAHAVNRAADRKKKLEDAVGVAGNFHEELNKFITWLTDTEKTLNNLQPVSRLLDRVTAQIEDHRILQKDVSGHREVMFALDKMGTHLKYFSQKQDVVLIKNLLSSVQHRWEKIVSRSAERTRHLERGYKEARQFYDSWKDLIHWLTEAEKALNSETSVSNEPEKIRAQMAKHKEFQRRLGSKQPVYDSINRSGSTLQNKSPVDDKPAIQALLTELKNKWNAVCGKSVDRQRKLEEGLLLTGQFSEALEGLLEWLAKVEPTLSEDTQVYGDLDTVTGFLEAHKAFQQELEAKANTVDFVRKSAKELLEKSTEDMSQVQSQLVELSTLWDRTNRLSVSKQYNLGTAHQLASEFHNKAQALLDWLADAERHLRFRGVIPDEEALILQQLEDHKKFEESMLRQEVALRECLNIGQDIMKRCHPDAVSTMKHWLGVLRERWEELMGMSRLRQKRLSEALTSARLNNTLLDELLVWLNGAEVKLTELDRETIPKDLQVIQDLIAQHQDFQNEMSSKQPSVDRLVKADKRRAGTEPGSNIPVYRGVPRNAPRSRIPTIRVDRADSSGRKTPDIFGRKTPDHFAGHRSSGRKTPDISGRKTPDVSGRMTPDHSGRRTPDHMSGRRTPDYLSGRRTPEPGFHNPRVGALFNKWRHVWLLAMSRHRKLQDALEYLNELERLKNFDFEEWRKRYLRWMNHNKARIMDFFRRQDHDRDGRVTRQEFIEGILQSKYPTSRLEMEAVADIFDKDGDGFINYKEFVAALRPDREPKQETDSEKIMDEVKRQVSKCTCVKQFKIHKIGEGKYRFGDSQKLRLVRILRSTVMVRVGGGWIALDEFLVKNDPCRAKGRTNLELREHFILATGVSQSMAGFVSKSPVGSSHSSGSSYSGRSGSTNASGPVTKIREKTVNQAPWRQRKASTDGEVHQIMSNTEPDGTQSVRNKLTPDLLGPRCTASPASRSSSRASIGSGSRPTSRTGSEAPEDTPEIFTTVQTEKQNRGGRNDTTVTYQTHVVQTRHVTLPTSTSSKVSRIPKISPVKKK